MNNNNKEQNFIRLDVNIITADLPMTAKVVYTALESFCYGEKIECFPSNKTIATMIGKSIRTVQRAIKLLREKGYISVSPRIGTSNLFTVLKKVITKAKEVATTPVKSYFNKKAKSVIKDLPFNDIPTRDYNYDNLESMLLGHEEYDPTKLYNK